MHRNDWVFHYEYEISENDLDPKLTNREGMEIVAEEQLEGAPKSKDTLDSLRRFPLGGFTELGGPGLEREGASAAAAACAAAGYHLRRRYINIETTVFVSEYLQLTGVCPTILQFSECLHPLVICLRINGTGTVSYMAWPWMNGCDRRASSGP